MINLDKYSLSPEELAAIEKLIAKTGHNLTLQDLYQLMDEVWAACGCDSNRYDEERYNAFYRHPIWLLNGIFIEQHEESLGNRSVIAETIREKNLERVLDFAGGFGTLARMIATTNPNCSVDIWDPFPPQHGIHACDAFPNIRFVSSPQDNTYDALVCTDVLEHVHDPLSLLANMVRKVRVGGVLIIYNCFYQVIQCHLPCTFHLLYSFDEFCQLLGLSVEGKTKDDHATIYSKVAELDPDWHLIRKREKASKLSHQVNLWKKTHPEAGPLRQKLFVIQADPLYYSRKIWSQFIDSLPSSTR
jgi:ubiquinone/menaquinone biosynthesis C-methylase UbiE